jgi:hypothetical protein
MARAEENESSEPGLVIPTNPVPFCRLCAILAHSVPSESMAPVPQKTSSPHALSSSQIRSGRANGEDGSESARVCVLSGFQIGEFDDIVMSISSKLSSKSGAKFGKSSQGFFREAYRENSRRTIID